MRAVLCKDFGTPETLSLEEIDEPMVGPTDVLVKVASAINFPDILMIEGKYQFKPEFPFSPGGEFSGLVEKMETRSRTIRLEKKFLAASVMVALPKKYLSRVKFSKKARSLRFSNRRRN